MDESMCPDYEPGSIVSIEPVEDPAGGGDVVVKLDSGIHSLKRLYIRHIRKYLCSLNPEFSRFDRSVSRQDLFLGMVIAC